ncbi:MAG: hypothetical protein Q8Q01_00320 [archaeon]|nr:hypothetical protein [archaeon]
MKKIIYLILIIFLISGCSRPLENVPTNELVPSNEQIIPPDYSNQLPREMPESPGHAIVDEPEVVQLVSKWKIGGSAIPGNYADADIIKLDDGKYRMYYSPEPEVPGFKGQIYSALSSDGITWSQESGERKQGATFPSLIKLSDGKYRMYFQSQGVINSASSSDGLNWKDDSGTRIDTQNNVGLNLDNVAAPTVIKFDNQYLMVYRGTINEKYPGQVPNNNIQLLLWAVSSDGLKFDKKGIALDSRNDEFQGLLDGPELVTWDDGSLSLYFWSYKGVYHVQFENGKFSQTSEFDFTTSTNPRMIFPENPPGDPTITRIGNKWFMYYGQHKEGIFYATIG